EEGVEDLAWARAHAFAALEAARKALASTLDDGSRRAFPASQAHRVRTALRRDPEGAERPFGHLLARYEGHGFSWPEPDGRLWLDAPGAAAGKLTRFQDALETLALFRKPRRAGGAAAGPQEEVTP
ncbi:MAG TPA: hypothetical protein VLF66_16235, partial [Thermoanaerobaculia bacterium]|nr:hypothetical protein [Thermoanaerobaculia bacterium]